MKKINVFLLSVLILFVFLDNDVACVNKEPITASMSSIVWREKSLEKVVQIILPQVDRLNVFLQFYKVVPSFLNHPKIFIASGNDYSEALSLGACAKFFWADTIKGYHIVIDDDILYPDDYVAQCIKKIEQYKRKVVIGFHGVVLRDTMLSYRDKVLYNFQMGLEEDTCVHILGTGTISYHSDTIKVTMRAFLNKNMADIWFGIVAQKQHVPLLCVQRLAGYLKSIEPTSHDPKAIGMIVQQNGGKDRVELIEQNRPWILYRANIQK
jgi:hypothetical protein